MATRHVLRDEHNHPLSAAHVKQVQKYLNYWRRRWLGDKTPLKVDGVPGRATHAAILGVKYYLGYGKDRDSRWTRKTKHRLEHPRSRKYSSAAMLATAFARRRAYRAAHTVNTALALIAPGVTRFDGVPCRTVVVPHLKWARARGWDGQLVSGWRSGPYSMSLCYRRCGRPACPGTCAGLRSNHVRIAIDVTDYQEFGGLMRSCPHRPRIFNALGARDPVHFSPNGV